MKRLILTFLFAGLLSVAVAQSNELFEIHLQAGIENFNKNKLSDAIVNFKEAKRYAPKNKVSIADNWISKCQKPVAEKKRGNEPPAPKVKEPELNVDIESFSFATKGRQAEVTVSATHPWYVSYQPSWCKCTPIESKRLEINCSKNSSTQSRSDSIVITMDGISKVIKVTQEAGLGKLFFQTTPENTNIRFVDKDIHIYPDSALYHLPAGSYHVEISKGGYATVDTLVVIPEQASEAPTIIHVNLPPLFGTIKLNIQAQKGYNFSSWPTIRIGYRDVDISSMFYNKKQRSLNARGNIEYYNLYEGNIIPVPCDSILSIRVKAKGFSDYTTTCAVSKGNTYPLNVSMEPLSGFLTITDQGNATGAKIIIDNVETDETVPVHRLNLGIGKHWLKFEKEGMISTRDSILVNIEEGQLVTENVAMNFFIRGNITSTPAGAQVFIDDKPVGFTQSGSDTLSIPLTEGTHKLTVLKEGFLKVEENITIKAGGNQFFNYTLEKNRPLYISGDDDNLFMTLKKDGKTVIETSLPTKVDIPYGKYKMTIKRSNNKTAYKGILKHDGKKEHKKILSYSRQNYYLLTGTYFITPLPVSSRLHGLQGSDKNYEIVLGEKANYYTYLANASIGNIKIAPGLSTNVIKANLFTRNKNKFNETIPANEAKEYKKMYDGADYLFGFSCIFINGEFRIGGAVHQNFDVNVLGSYAWMPNMKSFLPMSHASGHDAFVGAEVSSRIPIFNASLRMGWQMFKGEQNIRYKNEDNILVDSGIVKKKFYSTPMSTSQFVISIAIGLGGKDSKGANILRVW